MSMFNKKWRIVTDFYLGYEIQCKLWYWPFWVMPALNTSATLESAKKKLEGYKHPAKKKLERYKQTVVYTE